MILQGFYLDPLSCSYLSALVSSTLSKLQMICQWVLDETLSRPPISSGVLWQCVSLRNPVGSQCVCSRFMMKSTWANERAARQRSSRQQPRQDRVFSFSSMTVFTLLVSYHQQFKQRCAKTQFWKVSLCDVTKGTSMSLRFVPSLPTKTFSWPHCFVPFPSMWKVQHNIFLKFLQIADLCSLSLMLLESRVTSKHLKLGIIYAL